MEPWKRVARVGVSSLALVVGSAVGWGEPRQRSESPRAEPAKADDAVVLRIVDRSGKPLPSAEVRVAVQGAVRPSSMSSFDFVGAPATSLVDQMLERLPILHPDAAGELRCAWPSGRGLLVVGRCVDLFGQGWFDAKASESRKNGEPLRVELAPDWPLTVKVLDADGLPLEHPSVDLRAGARSLGLDGHGTEPLVFPHAGYELRDETQPCTVAAHGLFDPPVEVALDPRRAPEEQLALRLPSSGALEVLVLGPRRTGDEAWVEVQLVLDRPPSPGIRSAPRLGLKTSNGSARFDLVPLGREFDVSVRSLTGMSGRTRVAGPTTSGGTVRISVPVGAETILSGDAPLDALRPPSDASGTLRGKVLFPPNVPSNTLGISLRSGAARACAMEAELRRHCCNEHLEPLEIEATCGPDGSFEIPDVPLGPAKLEVRAAAVHLLSLALDVRPGADQDPRLAALDVRERMHARTISLRGVDPGRPFHARVLYSSPNSQALMMCYARTWSTPIVIPSPWDVLDVQLFATGYRSIELRDLREDTEVELRPGIPVRLRLVTDGTLPAPPRSLTAVLVSDQEPLRGLDWEGPAFGATHEILTRASGPGRMLVQWIVAETTADRSKGGGRVVEVLPTQVVDVLDTDAEQTFELTLPAAELARILAER